MGDFHYSGPQSIGTATINHGSGTIYDPCRLGLHVCGPDDEDAAATVLNVPCRADAEARELFERAKAECQVGPDEPEDLVVDLNTDYWNRDVEDDFCMSRQMLARFARLCGVEEPIHPWMSMRWLGPAARRALAQEQG